MSPLAWVLMLPIRLYRWVVSPLYTRPVCRFHPSCSAYALTALERHGAFKGSALAVYRILRCNPFHPGGVDDVPPRKAPVASAPRASLKL